MKKIITILIIICFLSVLFPQSDSNELSVSDNAIEWYNQLQIYDMVALPEEDADHHHITVNGLWNGFIAERNSPFAFGIYLESIYSNEVYETDEDFVDSQHEKGFIVPATILTTQGHSTFQGDQLEDFAC